MQDIFLQLLQVSVGRRMQLDYSPTAYQWQQLLRLAKEQAVIGVCADGIERLPETQRPPKEILLQWGFMALKIEQRNKYINGQTGKIVKHLEEDGFKVCLLKGQGAALYYPNPLRRQSGDIDLWLLPDTMAVDGIRFNLGRCRKQVVEYAHSRCEDCEICLHNIVFPVIRDIPVELHFIPLYFNSGFTGCRFRKYLCRNIKSQFENTMVLGMSCPTDEFNLIFLLGHIFKHFLSSGIGMRQIMDYYYVVKKWGDDRNVEDVGRMNRLRTDLKSLGLMKFCGAMMWVLHDVFGLEDDMMLVESDELQGRILLDNIISGGNFGQYMKDNPFECKPSDGHIIKFYKRFRTGMRLLRHYPSECIWSPFRIIEMFFILRYDKIRYR